ncbi:unnamed protein product [Camellia sinensis]
MVEEMLKQGSINNVGTVFSLTLYEANRLILDLCWTVSMFHRDFYYEGGMGLVHAAPML